MIVILEEKRSAAAHVYMCWCVGVMVVARAMMMNDEHKKSAKKCKKVIDNFKIV